MELHQLRSFVRIIREGSFTRAAEALFVSQSALSQQMKTLEQKLGVSLFERQGRRLHLTQAGEIVQGYAEQMLRLATQMEDELDAFSGLTQGRVRIGTSDTACLYLLPAVIQQFRQTYPNIEIHLTNRPSSEVLTTLHAGDIDVGIITLPPESLATKLPNTGQRLSDFNVMNLLVRRDVAICPPGHALTKLREVTLADLADYPLLLLDPNSTSRATLDILLAAEGLTPRVTDLGSIEVVKRYVEIGLGISVIPRMAVESEIETNRLQAIALPWLPASAVGWVQRRHAQLSPAVRTFYEMLVASLQTNTFSTVG